MADIMTKALGHELFEFHTNKLRWCLVGKREWKRGK